MNSTAINNYKKPDRVKFKCNTLSVVSCAELGPELKSIYDSHKWVYDYLVSKETSDVLRGRIPVVQGCINERELLVKRFSHGGALAALTKDKFLMPSRFNRYMKVVDFLIGKKVRTPPILFTSWRRNKGFCRGEIGVQYIPDGIDLSDYLFGQKNKLPDDTESCIRKMARIVSDIHQHQIYHPDLNLMNFLYVDQDKLWLLDLDKAAIRSFLSRGAKRSNVNRLFRSIQKQGAGFPEDQIEKIISIFNMEYGSFYA